MRNKSQVTNPKSQKVLGIDPGFDRCGAAIVEKENGKERVLFSHCIVTNKKAARADRLLQIGTELRKIIKKWKPGALAIETLFFNQNVSTGMGVAEARGMIIYICGEMGLSVHEYSPQDVKIAVTGYGKAGKGDVERMVGKLVRLPEKKKRLDDELDAVALGITHLASRKELVYK